MTSWLPFHFHVVVLAVVLALYALHRRANATHHQNRQAGWALVILAVFTLYPAGDLAATVSLTAATVQRLVLMLLVAPLLLLSTPTEWLARLTRPRFIDALVRRVCEPFVAIVTVTVLGTLTLSAPVVDAGAHHVWFRGLTLVLIMMLGIILWMPALGVMPGMRRLSPTGRAGYLIGSSIAVTSLSFIWIFSLHPLYPALHHQREFNMTPLFDQQLAGFVAKLGAYIPMWLTAFRVFFNAESEGLPVEEAPLHWADVERQLERIERVRAKRRRRGND